MPGYEMVLEVLPLGKHVRVGFLLFALVSEKTSNDIIAGNGRILSVHEYCVI